MKLEAGLVVKSDGVCLLIRLILCAGEKIVIDGWQKFCDLNLIDDRVAEVARGHGGPRRKVWTRTKILGPNIRHFVAN